MGGADGGRGGRRRVRAAGAVAPRERRPVPRRGRRRGAGRRDPARGTRRDADRDAAGRGRADALLAEGVAVRWGEDGWWHRLGAALVWTCTEQTPPAPAPALAPAAGASAAAAPAGGVTASRYALGAEGGGAVRPGAYMCSPRNCARCLLEGMWACRRRRVLRAAREARCKACFELHAPGVRAGRAMRYLVWCRAHSAGAKTGAWERTGAVGVAL